MGSVWTGETAGHVGFAASADVERRVVVLFCLRRKLVPGLPSLRVRPQSGRTADYTAPLLPVNTAFLREALIKSWGCREGSCFLAFPSCTFVPFVV